MNRPGMTMVELLLALALLAGLTVASVSWTTSTARVHAIEGGRAAWRVSAERALDLVDVALTITDKGLEERARERWRLRLGDDSLSLQTREVMREQNGQTIVCAWLVLKADSGVLRAAYVDDRGRTDSWRPLLGELKSLGSAAQTLDDRTVLVTIRLVHASGAAVERRWRLPEGAVQ